MVLNFIYSYLMSPANGVTEVITMLPFGKRGCKFTVKGVRHRRGLDETQLTTASNRAPGGAI